MDLDVGTSIGDRCINHDQPREESSSINK